MQPVWSSCLSVVTRPLFIKFPDPGGTNWDLSDEEVKPEGLVTQIRNIRNFHYLSIKDYTENVQMQSASAFSDHFFTGSITLQCYTL